MGCGPVGVSAVMTAKMSGAKVIVVEPFEKRRAIAKKFGADYVVDPTAVDLVAEIERLTDGRMGTVVVEASGNDKAIASLFEVAGHSARVRLIGHSIGRKVPVELGRTIWRTLSISGSGGTRNFGQRTIRFMTALKEKGIDFGELNTHYYPFGQIHEAFDTACKLKSDAFKVMLTFDVK
jgi:threonine dehydrogenase-like Zn-dependent dehydrogenase